ncbi:P-loop containing nucleoside triphosphate hydrolase protein [Tuber borchii]|uniref:P-loop containing nucleoside triphosphate hydrolase protein n=1 Tax=Tuber borchii TaxID=42251 RepID=A0A2T6ZT48_TUBBO|nr:P-loop containing nucleoside triphosphate hydrolase protein [Tuber borchii]
MSSTITPPNTTPKKNLTILLLGSPSTGKTNFITRQTSNVFSGEHTPTLEEVYTTTLLSHPGTALTILDLGGSDDLERLRSVFLTRGDIDGYVIVYAVDDVQSWRNIGEKWWGVVEHWNGGGGGRKGKVFVIGCKGDLIDEAGGNGFVENGGIVCSALEGWGVVEAWERVLRGCLGE